MARQDVVRALVPRQEIERITHELTAAVGVREGQIEVSDADPGTYRDDQPSLELRRLVRTGRVRLAIGAAIGAVIGALVAVAVPPLREFAPISVILLAFGGALGAGVAVAARSVQTHRDTGSRPDKLIDVSEQDEDAFSLVTIRDLDDRTPVVDHLTDRGVTLLDTHHPRVGRDEPGARPADSGNDDVGPPAQ